MGQTRLGLRLGFRLGSWVRLTTSVCENQNLDPNERFRIIIVPKNDRGNIPYHLRTEEYGLENKAGQPLMRDGNIILFRASALIPVYSVKNSGKRKKRQEAA